MCIINLTQHDATAEQLAAGVVDLPAEDRANLQNWLTFDDLPTWQDVDLRAERIARLCISNGGKEAMIGGAPWLMAPLERWLTLYGVVPLYAFSRRESVEQIQPDGSVRKEAVFRHLGFVRASS